MLKELAEIARPVLEMGYIRRTRRNHGLEHATIHLLNLKHYRLSGRSTDGGFVILGNVPTAQVEEAADEALRRMREGEHGLAVHPNCGTNLVTTGALTTLMAALALGGRGRKTVIDRFPTAMLLVMFALLFSQPLGLSIQRHFTTEGDPGDMEILRVTRSEMRLPLRGGRITMHRVVTHSS
jgi:hypothetical protein